MDNTSNEKLKKPNAKSKKKPAPNTTVTKEKTLTQPVTLIRTTITTTGQSLATNDTNPTETKLATTTQENAPTEKNNLHTNNKDTQSRRYLLTLNDPIPKGFTHHAIKNTLMSFKGIRYYCLADEQGTTYHTHIYAVFHSPVRFSTIRNKFNNQVHIDQVYGSSSDCRAYVAKEGDKWEGTDKQETRIDGTFEEWGELPQEHQGARNDLSFLYEMVEEGYSNFEIIEENPDFLLRINDIERVRQMIHAENNRQIFRELVVTYIFGATATGKTRHVMEKYGYENVYRVTDYKNPFDAYKGENVLIFDEFTSHLRIQDMNNYLDGYPLDLPCRYANKQACFTKVYIISNIKLTEQYTNIQTNEPTIWQAFLRRIHHVMEFTSVGVFTLWSSEEYITQATIGVEVEHGVNLKDTPFYWVK